MGNNWKKAAGSSPRIDSAIPLSDDDVKEYFESEIFKRSGCLQIEKLKISLGLDPKVYVSH